MNLDLHPDLLRPGPKSRTTVSEFWKERLRVFLNSWRGRNEEKSLLSLAGCGTRNLVSFFNGWTFGGVSHIFYDRLHWDCDYDANSPFFG